MSKWKCIDAILRGQLKEKNISIQEYAEYMNLLELHSKEKKQ